MITSTRDRRLSPSVRSASRSGRGCGADLVQLLQEQLCIALDRIQGVAQIVPQLGLKLAEIDA
jgi:hypothetical protein